MCWWRLAISVGGIYDLESKTKFPTKIYKLSMVTLEMSKQTKNWNGPLQVERAKMEIQ